jgi:hypothetical protein
MMMHDDWSGQGAQEFVAKMRCLTCGKARSDIPVSVFKVRALLDSVGALIRRHEVLYREAWSFYATENVAATTAGAATLAVEDVRKATDYS